MRALRARFGEPDHVRAQTLVRRAARTLDSCRALTYLRDVREMPRRSPVGPARHERSQEASDVAGKGSWGLSNRSQ